MEILEKCENRLDLEKFIMRIDDLDKIKATITYKSGRVETLEADLLKSGLPPKASSRRVAQSRQFPTVKNVKVNKFNENP